MLKAKVKMRTYNPDTNTFGEAFCEEIEECDDEFCNEITMVRCNDINLPSQWKLDLSNAQITNQLNNVQCPTACCEALKDVFILSSDTDPCSFYYSKNSPPSPAYCNNPIQAGISFVLRVINPTTISMSIRYKISAANIPGDCNSLVTTYGHVYSGDISNYNFPNDIILNLTSEDENPRKCIMPSTIVIKPY